MGRKISRNPRRVYRVNQHFDQVAVPIQPVLEAVPIQPLLETLPVGDDIEEELGKLLLDPKYEDQDYLTKMLANILNIALYFLYDRITAEQLRGLIYDKLQNRLANVEEIVSIILQIDQPAVGITDEDVVDIEDVLFNKANELKKRLLVFYFQVRYAVDYQPCANRVEIKKTRDVYKAAYKRESSCAIMGGKKKSRKSKSKKSRKTRRR